MIDLDELQRWNAWANGLVLEALKSSGGEPMKALAAFHHVVVAEAIWLRRIQDSPAGPDQLWSKEPSLADVERLFAEVTAGLPVVTAGDLGASASYANSKGERFTDAIEEILTHVFMHSSQYRGEALGLLSNAGHQVPDLDLAFWRRMGRPD